MRKKNQEIINTWWGDPEARLGGVWINGRGYFLKCFSFEKHIKIMLFIILFKFIFDISTFQKHKKKLI